jgi:hypothetical protein
MKFARCCLGCRQIETGCPVWVASLQLLAGNDSPLSLLKLRRRGRLAVKFRIDFANLRQRRACPKRQRDKNNDVRLTSSKLRSRFHKPSVLP